MRLWILMTLTALVSAGRWPITRTCCRVSKRRSICLQRSIVCGLHHNLIKWQLSFAARIQNHRFEKSDAISPVSAAGSSEAASDEQESPEVEQLLIRQRRDEMLTFTNDTDGEYGKCRCTNARQCRWHGYKNFRTKNAVKRRYFNKFPWVLL